MGTRVRTPHFDSSLIGLYTPIKCEKVQSELIYLYYETGESVFCVAVTQPVTALSCLCFWIGPKRWRHREPISITQVLQLPEK